MKTLAYNPQREILTTLMTLILSFCLLTAVKAQGNPNLQAVSDGKNAMIEGKAFKLTNANLIEEDTIDNFLEMKIKSWIGDGSYWNKDADEETIVSKLASKIARWMSDGSFWSLDSNEETVFDEFALSNKDEMTFSAFDTTKK